MKNHDGIGFCFMFSFTDGNLDSATKLDSFCCWILLWLAPNYELLKSGDCKFTEPVGPPDIFETPRILGLWKLLICLGSPPMLELSLKAMVGAVDVL